MEEVLDNAYICSVLAYILNSILTELVYNFHPASEPLQRPTTYPP
jgi:hypothetical protein